MSKKDLKNYHIITISFPENAKAYQLFSELKRHHVDGVVKLQQIVVIEREENGTFAFKDAVDLSISNKVTKGAVIGMAVGILAGPFGVIFGTLAGGLIGSSKELKRMKKSEELFKKTIGSIEPDTTGVIAIGVEYDESVLNGIVAELGGDIVRTDEEF